MHNVLTFKYLSVFPVSRLALDASSEGHHRRHIRPSAIQSELRSSAWGLLRPICAPAIRKQGLFTDVIHIKC